MMGHEQRPEDRNGGGYFVRRPRSTDAIGTSLRTAYTDVWNLPEDMAGTLHALDRLTSRH